MKSKQTKKSFGTHDGTFHADEVTACALLLAFDLIERDEIVRTREAHLLEQCEFLCDVGGIYNPADKKFDHHQAEYDGLLSSAGMVLNYLLSEKKISRHEHHFLYHTYIKGVDEHDNGKDPQIDGVSTYSYIIANFTPVKYSHSKKEEQKAFFEALDFALSHLKRLLERHAYIQSCKEIVANAMKNGTSCLLFDQPIPWLDLFFELGGETHPAKFIIMPSGPHWKLRGVPPNLQDKMEVRVPLPTKWAGMSDQELKQASGIEGAIFCHKGRFISIWETKKDALLAYEKILETME